MAGSGNARKGQIYSFDALAALTLLFFLLATFFLLDGQVRDKELAWHEQQTLTQAAEEAGALLMTTGNPADWSESNFHSLGLLAGPGEFSPEKVSSFVSLAGSDYEKARGGLGLYRSGRSFDFSFALVSLAGKELYEFHPAQATAAGGAAADSGGKDKIVIQRYAVFQGEPAVLRLEVWPR